MALAQLRRFSLAGLDKHAQRLQGTVAVNWHLGFTSFGGPPVHFKIFHDKFVQKLEWVSEETYHELFSVCQALSGPASTKLHYCINLIHGGFPAAVLGFLIWSLPGALGMYGLSIGVSNMGTVLPRAAYALLSGLNAATVGIILLAAVELSEKAGTDQITRTVVFLGGAAGLLYNALWYFPLLIFVAGCATVVHDYRWVHRLIKGVTGLFNGRRERHVTAEESVDLSELRSSVTHQTRDAEQPSQGNDESPSHDGPRVVPSEYRLDISWKLGVAIITTFLMSFTVVMVLRGVLSNPPLLYSLFTNMYLAGTIIFGGGPVVIPLLREYVVTEGWVQPRDFLIGLAITQAFPGPNFNFAVFLGSLTATNGGYNSVAGAVIAFLGIFVPGLVSVHGTMGIWSALRNKRWIKSSLRGVNAAAVGLIYTAVYRLWQIGYVDEGFQSGKALGDDPWWVVVTATSYVGGRWYKAKPPVAIVLGAILGLIRYAVVSR